MAERTQAEVNEYVSKMAKEEGITRDEAKDKLIRFGIHRRVATVNYEKKIKKGEKKRSLRKAAPKKAKARKPVKKVAKAKAPRVRKAAVKPAEAPVVKPAEQPAVAASNGAAPVLD